MKHKLAPDAFRNAIDSVLKTGRDTAIDGMIDGCIILLQTQLRVTSYLLPRQDSEHTPVTQALQGVTSFSGSGILIGISLLQEWQEKGGDKSLLRRNHPHYATEQKKAIRHLLGTP